MSVNQCTPEISLPKTVTATITADITFTKMETVCTATDNICNSLCILLPSTKQKINSKTPTKESNGRMIIKHILAIKPIPFALISETEYIKPSALCA